MIKLIPGDFVRFNNKLYTIHQDRDGNPIFQRVYLSSIEAYEETTCKLEETIKKVNVSVSVPI